MHYTKKNKYVGLKEAGLTADELRVQMLADSIKPDEAEKLIVELYTPVQDLHSVEQPAVSNDTVPGEKKAAVKFDYSNLSGEAYKEYEEHIHGLPLHQMADFVVYKVAPVITERYPGLVGTPRDLTGIRITDNSPVHSTRIPPRHAIEMNAQVRNTNRYYLLKQ